MNSKDRMDSWKKLPEPKPPWEAWKRILARKNYDPIKAKEEWEKISKKKVDLSSESVIVRA